MAADTPQFVTMWTFTQAPPEFRKLFPEGGKADWVAYVPGSQRQTLEPTLLQWQGIYPIRSTELSDRSIVYWGAPREAMRLITEPCNPAIGRTTVEQERRASIRVPMVCRIRYETHSDPKYVGIGHTIDMSNAGIAFTTESLLPANEPITLHVAWPVRLNGDVPIELHAAGRLARTESMRAALQLDTMSLSIAE